MAIEHYAKIEPLETQMGVVKPANPEEYDPAKYAAKEASDASTKAAPMSVVAPYEAGHEPESAPENLMAKEDSKMKEAPAPKADKATAKEEKVEQKFLHKQAEPAHKGFFSKK